MNYQKQAQRFLKNCNAILSIKELENQIAPFFNDNKYRRTFKITIKRNGLTWSFKFYGNLNGDDITAYDVLACIQKNEVSENLFDFMNEYGYTINEDHKKMIKLHKAVIKEYENVIRLFGDVIEKLQEIQ
jgi:hypothetical protein